LLCSHKNEYVPLPPPPERDVPEAWVSGSGVSDLQTARSSDIVLLAIEGSTVTLIVLLSEEHCPETALRLNHVVDVRDGDW
jgi:hypothetical protein